MFCTSSASWSVRIRTCSSGLYLTLAPVASVGSNFRQMCPARLRQPAVMAQFSPLRSWTITECGQRQQSRNHHAGALAAAGRREYQHVRLSAIAQKPAAPKYRHEARKIPALSGPRPSRCSRIASRRRRLAIQVWVSKNPALFTSWWSPTGPNRGGPPWSETILAAVTAIAPTARAASGAIG